MASWANVLSAWRITIWGMCLFTFRVSIAFTRSVLGAGSSSRVARDAAQLAELSSLTPQTWACSLYFELYSINVEIVRSIDSKLTLAIEYTPLR
ncbi:hypothetical protein T492DRAFT_960613 [Pavlovales sp. CCMP2436]|nr:hypothetical protein T492DRAFT_960613 [Pavlovales sp. CCMP2436]